MEHALGKKSYNSILHGNMQFEREFAKQYGMPLMIYMAYRTRMLLAGDRLNGRFEDLQIFDKAAYFKKTQDVLMRKIFDKDSEKIENIEDAKLYLQKLRTFETVRGRISTKEKESDKFVEDTSFREYYDEKYNNVIEMLQSKGITKSEIESQLEKYKYERQDFKPLHTKEEEKEDIKHLVTFFIAEESVTAKKIMDINRYGIKYIRVLPNSFHVVVLKKETEKEEKEFDFVVIENDEEENFYEKYKGFYNIEYEEEPLQYWRGEEYQEEKIEKYKGFNNIEYEEGHLRYWRENGYQEETIEFKEGEFERRIKNQFIAMQKDLEYKIFNAVMYGKDNEETKEQIKNMQLDSKFIQQVLEPEKSEKPKEENNISPELAEEMLKVAEKQGIFATAEAVCGSAGADYEPMPGKKIIKEKIAKLRGLISLKKSQDKEIEKLETEVEKKGKTIDEQ